MAEPAVAVRAQEPVAALVREPVPVRAAPVVLLVAPVLAAVVQVLPVLVEAVPVAARRIARQRGVPDRADELAPARRCCSKKGNLAERPLNGKSGLTLSEVLAYPLAFRRVLPVAASPVCTPTPVKRLRTNLCSEPLCQRKSLLVTHRCADTCRESVRTSITNSLDIFIPPERKSAESYGDDVSGAPFGHDVPPSAACSDSRILVSPRR